MKKKSLLFFILPALIITACTKIITTDIGGELLPPGDGVTTKDMFLDVVSKNIKDTSTRVATSDQHVLGYVKDPLFGETAAEINLELKPASFPFNFPVPKDSLLYDSVVLVLSYNGSWGDTSKNLGVRVFDLTNDDPANDLQYDTVYSTSYAVSSENELTEFGMPKTVEIPRLKDSVKPFNEAAANQLRIRLDASFGQQLLQYDTSTAYKSDSLFTQYIKGFKIKPEIQGNALLRINLLDTNTKLAIYFRYKSRDTIGKIDTAVRYFRCNSYNCGSTNYVTHQRSSGEVNTYLNPANTYDSLIYIDANPGLYSNLSVPALFADTIPNRIIHRAELLLEQVPDESFMSADNIFTPPNLFLSLYSQDSARRFSFVNDMVFSSGTVINQNTFGCFPYKKKDPVTQKDIYVYNFDISRYIQGILTRNDKAFNMVLFAPFNESIYITETSTFTVFTGTTAGPINYPAIGRIRLGGGNHTRHRMKLHIVYTEID